MPVFESRVPASAPSLSADILLVPVAAPPGDLARRVAPFGAEVARTLERVLTLGDFDARAGTVLPVPVTGDARFPRLALVGLGGGDGLSPAVIRKAFAAAGRGLGERVGTAAVACVPPLVGGPEARARLAAVVDGLLDASFRWTLASAPPKRAERVLLVAESARHEGVLREGIAEGRILGEAAMLAREIGNAPANRMSPADLADRARAAGKAAGLEVRILDEKRLAKERCEALLAVGGGSSRPPRLVVLRYEPERGPAGPPVALVGKGIVFDTGGYDIKPSASMVLMRLDKCGAAAVIGAMSALRALQVPVPVVAVVACAENSISGTAYRPGDIIGTRAGKTVDVQNTDAEGRLVLADALDFAITTERPRAVVDVATLTGAAFHALGDLAAPVLGTDAGLVARLRESGERTGERAWELPLWAEALADVEGSASDLRNTGPYGAGTIAGAAFLRAFVGDVPWAHLDIANVAWNRRDPKAGANGFGTRLLLDALRRWPVPRSAAKRRPGGK